MKPFQGIEMFKTVHKINSRPTLCPVTECTYEYCIGKCKKKGF
jgi:hypothetical protein